MRGTRSTLEEWIETRRLISDERRNWALGRQTLQDQIDVVKDQIESFRARIAEAEASIAEADEKRAELMEQAEQLKALSGDLATIAANLETRTKGLLPRLPEPLLERIKPLSQQLPTSPSETELGLGQRFGTLAVVLKAINKFHREITVTSEVRQLQDGSSAEVAALYVGLGGGYYVDANRTVAGVGAPTTAGWVWRPAHEAAADIGSAIAMQKNEIAAKFVKLPVSID